MATACMLSSMPQGTKQWTSKTLQKVLLYQSKEQHKAKHSKRSKNHAMQELTGVMVIAVASGGGKITEQMTARGDSNHSSKAKNIF